MQNANKIVSTSTGGCWKFFGRHPYVALAGLIVGAGTLGYVAYKKGWIRLFGFEYKPEETGQKLGNIEAKHSINMNQESKESTKQEAGNVLSHEGEVTIAQKM